MTKKRSQNQPQRSLLATVASLLIVMTKKRRANGSFLKISDMLKT
jgi:hypothetical protein